MTRKKQTNTKTSIVCGINLSICQVESSSVPRFSLDFIGQPLLKMLLATVRNRRYSMYFYNLKIYLFLLNNRPTFK